VGRERRGAPELQNSLRVIPAALAGVCLLASHRHHESSGVKTHSFKLGSIHTMKRPSDKEAYALDDHVANYERFKKEIDGYIDYCEHWARIFGALYYSIRTLLIVFSALVAANVVIPFGIPVRAISLLVAIGTALDTWLKTGTRYKGHYMFHEKFLALYIEVELTDPGDKTKLEPLKKQFVKLIGDYGVAALPS
jgi:hypothetical protein